MSIKFASMKKSKWSWCSLFAEI